MISPTLVQCYTPVNTDFTPESPYNAQAKALEVSLNGVDWTNSGQRFTFYDHARVFVSLLEPQGGPLQGGTAITVHGNSFRFSEHLKCTWDDDTNPALKVDATFVNFHVMLCESPPASAATPTPRPAGFHNVKVALDNFHFSAQGQDWTYYDPAALVVSAVDPVGGPARGGTLIEIVGSGFAQLGGQAQHGLPAFGANHTVFPHRRIDHGVFCKFSFDAARSPRGEDPWCTKFDHTEILDHAQSTNYYDGTFDSSPLPDEGAAAMTRAASNRHLRNFTCFTASSTPSLGRMTSIMQATFVDGSRILCESPPFAGLLRNNRAVLNVHVTLNGDYHDLTALSNSNATYMIYDPREARIHTMLRTGGPINGSTYVVLSGKLFFDFSSVARVGGHEHVLRCRFSFAGETLATWVDETAVACLSPRLYGFGHRQAVAVDLTFNGQDYVEGPNMRFLYSPRDLYQIEGQCRDQYGAAAEGTCLNNYTGVAVSALYPHGGPSSGETHIVVIGRLFDVQGPSILCKFGNLSMVSATFLNESAVLCTSPPATHMEGRQFIDHSVEVTLNGEPNFLTDSRIPFVYYDHNATLSVSSIYPQAGPKTGGNTITVYGTGFRVLGGTLTRACDAEAMNETNSEALYGDGRTEGSLSQGRLNAVGDSRVCSEPLIDGTNRGLQCLFGSMPPVHGYLLRIDASDPLRPRPADDAEPDDRVGTALICELPALPNEEEQSWIPGENELQLLPGSPHSVCVEVTLNGNRSQATSDCVEFTYYDT